MKYAIKFYTRCSVFDKVSEIIIKYSKRSADLLRYVAEAKPETRIIINITELEDIENSLDIFQQAVEVHPHFAIMLSYSQKDIIDKFKEAEIKFFFKDYVDSFDKLDLFISYGVSDVYIVNELGFFLKSISKRCHAEDVLVRVFPNVAQSSIDEEINTHKSFFIRPEDVYLYESFVDVMEFFGPPDKQSVLFNIYTAEKWQGMTEELIIGFKESMRNSTVIPHFGVTRLRCEKRCTRGASCSMCDTALSIGETMKTFKLEFTGSYES